MDRNLICSNSKTTKQTKKEKHNNNNNNTQEEEEPTKKPKKKRRLGARAGDGRELRGGDVKRNVSSLPLYSFPDHGCANIV